MAAKSLFLVPLTLCFFLVLAAQGKERSVAVIVRGEAKCKNNPSWIMSNTTLHLMINKTTVPGAGTTTSTGQIVMTVNLNSTEQLVSLLSNSSKALITAPPHTCGAPDLPAGKVVAARLQLQAVLVSGRPNDDGKQSAVNSMVIPVIKGKLHATNDADAARLNSLLKVKDNGEAARSQPPLAASDGMDVQSIIDDIKAIIVAVEKFACLALTG